MAHNEMNFQMKSCKHQMGFYLNKSFRGVNKMVTLLLHCSKFSSWKVKLPDTLRVMQTQTLTLYFAFNHQVEIYPLVLPVLLLMWWNLQIFSPEKRMYSGAHNFLATIWWDVHMPVPLFTEPQEDQVIRLRTLALKQYGRSVSEAWIWGLPRW